MKNKALKSILFSLIALISLFFVVSFVRFYVGQEDPIYYWDYGGYFNAFRNFGYLFLQSHSQYFKSISYSIAHDDYGPFPVVFLLPFYLIFGGSRISYIESTSVLYLIPVALLSARIATIKMDRSKFLFILAFVFALLYTPFWAPTLRGYPGVGGLIFLGGAIYIAFSNCFLTAGSTRKFLEFFVLLWASFLFRRWYSFSVIAVGGLCVVFSVIETYSLDKKYNKIIDLAIKYMLGGLLALCFGIYFQAPLLLRILHTNYSNSYSFYQDGLKTTILTYYSNFGLFVLLMVGISLATSIMKKNTFNIFLMAAALTTAWIFSRVQTPGMQHVLPIAFMLFPLYFEGVIISSKAAAGLLAFIGGAVQKQKKYFSEGKEKFKFFFALVFILVLVAAIILLKFLAILFVAVFLALEAIYLISGWKNSESIKVAYLVFFLLALGVFANTFTLLNLSGVPIIKYLPPKAVLAPLKIGNFSEYQKLASDLHHLPGSGRFGVVAASGDLNSSLLLAIDSSLANNYVNEADVDSRDHFFWSLLQAQFLILGTPDQVEHPPGLGERVITIPANDLRNGQTFGASFKKYGSVYNLANGVQAQIYEKIAPITADQIRALVKQFSVYYPEWFPSVPPVSGTEISPAELKITDSKDPYFGLPGSPFQVFWDAKTNTIFFDKGACSEDDISRTFFVHAIFKGGFERNFDFSFNQQNSFVTKNGGCGGWRQIDGRPISLEIGQYTVEFKSDSTKQTTYTNYWAGTFKPN